MVFMDAIIRGRVCVSVKDMNKDKRYSFQHSIKTSMKVAESPGFERGGLNEVDPKVVKTAIETTLSQVYS